MPPIRSSRASNRQGRADRSLAPDTANAYALLGWEFFIPEDTDKSDVELLRMACKLAVRKDLREHRQSFHYWLKLMHEGGIDPKAASADMLNRLQEYRAIIAGSEVKTVARYVAKFAPIYGPLVEAVN